MTLVNTKDMTLEERRAAQEARRQRAEAELASGALRVEKVGDHWWRVHSTNNNSYDVRCTDGGWSCSCPDYQVRCSPQGISCKHIYAVRIHIRNLARKALGAHQPQPSTAPSAAQPAAAAPQGAQAAQPARNGQGQAQAAKPASQSQPAQPAKLASQPAAKVAARAQTAQQPAQPSAQVAKPPANGQGQAKAAVQAAKPAQAAQKPAAQAAKPAQSQPAQTVATEDPAQVVVHWGNHRGKTLGQLAEEAPQFLRWIAWKMEPRSEQDKRLQAAARQLVDRLKAERRAGQKASKGGGKGGDPLAAFLAAAAVELVKDLWAAQAKGRDVEDEVTRRALELRLRAIRRVAEILRSLEM